MPHMKQLSGLDATFLYLETAQMPMHVGALHVFELPAGFKGKFVTALRKHMAQRLPVAAVLRRRLWWMPLNLANPAWVDADPDLNQHIVEIKLPPSAKLGDGWRELEAEVSRLHPVLLDRKKPLWKFHVFEGLAPTAAGRKRVGMYSQLHHAAVDGQAAVALANAILDVSPAGRAVEAKPSGRTRIFKLEMSEMLRGVIALQAQKVASIVKDLPSTVGTLKDAAAKAAAGSALLGGKAGGGKGPSNLTLAPRTVLNASVTAGRAFARVSLPLAELKDIGRAHDATINDMVLAVCSGALRRYFGKHRTLPKKSLIAAVPISLRAKGDTSSDNQASMSLISLGTHIADPAKRLAHVMAASAAMKGTMGSIKSILPTDFPSLGVPWLMEAVTALYGKAKVADRIPQVANVVISNVPGPPVPLYLAGGLMTTNYPTSIIVHGIALNITVQSYDQHLDFGLMADAAAMPDVRDLADAITVAFDDLRALPRPGEAGHEDTPTLESVVRKAGRDAVSTVGNTVGRLARSMVKTAVDSTVRGAVAQVTGRSPRKPVKAAVSRASTPTAARKRG
jgi:diacylglycerol O-acyltransferase / wax synthase